MQNLNYKLHILLALFMLIPAFAMAGGKDMSPNPNARSKKFIICLDPGHGGKDAGAVGSKRTNCEKDINLAITKEVKRLLSVNCSDVKIVCTRETDVFVELGRRAEIANNAKANLFISVHTNAIPRTSRKARGVQSYTLAPRGNSTNLQVEMQENSVISLEGGKYKEMYANSNSAESIIMWELMQQKDLEESVKFAKLTQEQMETTGGRPRGGAGVCQGNFQVLRCTYMPSVLLEVGYISTEDEEEFLMSTYGRNKMARSIYNAIIQYKAKVTGRESTLAPADVPEEQVTVETTTTTAVTTPPAAPTTTASNSTAKQTTNTATTSKTATTTAVDSSKPVFKIQLAQSSFDLKENDPQWKGLKVEKVKDGNKFYYYHGSTTDFNEIKKVKNEIKDKVSGFIVAFKNGQKIDTNAAIEEWKKTK